MRPSELANALLGLLNVKVPAFVWGPPGIYKSSVIRQVAGRATRPLIDVRAVLLDPVDLRGLPSINQANGRTRWCPPEFLPFDPESNAIIFLDELPQAAPLVQSACLQLTLDRRLGEYELPPGVTIVAAGNRQEDRAGTHRLITPLLNRFVHLDAEVSVEDWQAWALANAIDPRVRSFIGFKPDALFMFDPKLGERAFPTPRSWEMVSRVLINSGLSNGSLNALVKGCVGEGAGVEFAAFCNTYGKLPDARKVLQSADSFVLPDQPDILHAMCGSMIEVLRTDNGVANEIAVVASRLPQEFGILLMRDATLVARNKVMNTTAGKKFILEHAQLLASSIGGP